MSSATISTLRRVRRVKKHQHDGLVEDIAVAFRVSVIGVKLAYSVLRGKPSPHLARKLIYVMRWGK